MLLNTLKRTTTGPSIASEYLVRVSRMKGRFQLEFPDT